MLIVRIRLPHDGTLFNQTKAMTTEESDRSAKVDNTKTAVRQCGYPEWAFKTVEKKIQEDNIKKKKKDERKKNLESTSGMLVVLPIL